MSEHFRLFATLCWQSVKQQQQQQHTHNAFNMYTEFRIELGKGRN